MLHVRRGVAPVFFVPAGVVAILAALTLHALAQPASRPPNTPPPGLEDPSQDAAQREVRGRPIRRASPRPANTMPNFDNPETTDRAPTHFTLRCVLARIFEPRGRR